MTSAEHTARMRYLLDCYDNNVIYTVSQKTTLMLHTKLTRFRYFFPEMLLKEYAIKRWVVIPPRLTNVSALLGETWTPEIGSFQSCCIPCLEKDTVLACYIFDTHHLSICRPLSAQARRRTAQCSPILRQQRTPSATRRTLADNAACVQERCRTTSHCSARRRYRWLATLQWTVSKSTASSGNFYLVPFMRYSLR